MFGIALSGIISGAKALLKNTGIGKKIISGVGGLFGRRRKKVATVAADLTKPIFKFSGISKTLVSNTTKKDEKFAKIRGNKDAKDQKFGGGGNTDQKDTKFEDDTPVQGAPMSSAKKDMFIWLGLGVLGVGLVSYLAKKK